MTDEQFEKFMAMQAAQLAMLQSISRNVQALVMKTGRISMHNWKDLQQDLQHATEFVKAHK
jgi:hypothetical protein